METQQIRQKLHELIDTIEDKKVEAIYTLFEDEIEQGEFELTEAQLKFLDEEREKHLSGNTPSYSWEDAKQIIKSRNIVANV